MDAFDALGVKPAIDRGRGYAEVLGDPLGW